MTDRATAGEPSTQAGLELLYDPEEGYPAGLEEAVGSDATQWRDAFRKRIRAIEAQAGNSSSSLDVDQLAFGMFMSLQPRTRRQWEELPDAMRDHWQRRADAALYHARTSESAEPTANPEERL